jgi:hypothetical protein
LSASIGSGSEGQPRVKLLFLEANVTERNTVEGAPPPRLSLSTCNGLSSPGSVGVHDTPYRRATRDGRDVPLDGV